MAEQAEPAVLYEKEGKVAIVTINRPSAQNAVNRAVQVGLEEAWTNVRDDPNISVAILTGAGDRYFCTGGDVNEGMDSALMEEAPGGLQTKMIPDLKGIAMWKPVIGAINGFAVGDGANMLLATDIRITSDRAVIFWPEASIGSIPFGGALARLVRQVPYCHVMKLLLTSDRITAHEAWRIGLVNEVVFPSEVMPRAKQLARQMAEYNPTTLRMMKECVLRGLNVGLDQAFIQESLYAALLFAHPK